MVFRTDEVSKPDKVLFAGDAITKLDLARYFEAVAPAMVPLIAGRPLNLQRFPDGIAGKELFTQQAPKHFPAWIARATVPKRGGTVDHVVVERADTLVYLAGQACTTLHAWTSRRDRLDRPDRLIIDFDPQVDDFAAVRRAALAAGELFRECGLEPFAMVTGSRGIHVVAPLKRLADHAAVGAVARALAAELVRRTPGELSTEFTKANRGDRIYVDAGRARWGHTAVTPYSVRGRPGAPVATPLRWPELEDDALRPDAWTLRTLPARLAEHGCPWSDVADHARSLGWAMRALGT